jgi:hypothetical protein
MWNYWLEGTPTSNCYGSFSNRGSHNASLPQFIEKAGLNIPIQWYRHTNTSIQQIPTQTGYEYSSAELFSEQG